LIRFALSNMTPSSVKLVKAAGREDTTHESKNLVGELDRMTTMQWAFGRSVLMTVGVEDQDRIRIAKQEQ
jgi:hypothetical protein